MKGTSEPSGHISYLHVGTSPVLVTRTRTQQLWIGVPERVLCQSVGLSRQVVHHVVFVGTNGRYSPTVDHGIGILLAARS
jgi:hypothetical protein